MPHWFRCWEKKWHKAAGVTLHWLLVCYWHTPLRWRWIECGENVIVMPHDYYTSSPLLHILAHCHGHHCLCLSGELSPLPHTPLSRHYCYRFSLLSLLLLLVKTLHYWLLRWSLLVITILYAGDGLLPLPLSLLAKSHQQVVVIRWSLRYITLSHYDTLVDIGGGRNTPMVVTRSLLGD